MVSNFGCIFNYPMIHYLDDMLSWWLSVIMLLSTIGIIKALL